MEKKKLTEDDVLFVLGICRKSFEKNSDLANDCFAYVWEKLHEDESRRIKAFQGKSNFRTFLYSVTSKLVIDFRRIQFKHKALPKYYWGFDEINRRVFKLFFYQNSILEWVKDAIQAEFKIGEEEAQKRVDEIKRVVEKKIRSDTTDERQPVLLGENTDAIASEDRRANPEENVLTAEAERKKQAVLKALKEESLKLNPEDALILQLYFERGLTAKEISGAIPGVKQKRVYKRIDKILKRLERNLRERGITAEDIKEIFERLL